MKTSSEKPLQPEDRLASSACAASHSTCPAPNPSDVARLSEFYKIMGDETRLKLLLALQNGEQCVSDLAAACQMTLSAISHQLKVLKDAKLVKGRRQGKLVYYSLDDDHIHAVISVALTHLHESD